MKYVIGIDLGTSGTKTVLFDESGKAVYSVAGGTDDYKAMYLDLKARVDEAVRLLTM